MDIIIGRHPNTRQLNIIKGTTQTSYGQANSVPMDVSRQHLSLSPLGGGKWLLKNLNEKNVTFVNGLAAESKTVSESDKIELGNSHYLLSWDAVRGPKVETVDIRPLKIVWETYQQENDKNEIRKQKLAFQKQKQNILRGLTGIFIPLAIVLSIYSGRENPLYIVLYCLPPLITLIMTISQYNGIKNEEEAIVKEKEKRRERDIAFRRDYSCPKCKKYLSMPYDVLERYDNCPYCKAKFTN